METFFFGRDNSGHWYLVPTKIRDQWNQWTDLDEDNEASWVVPEGATRVDGPHRIIFSNPVEI